MTKLRAYLQLVRLPAVFTAMADIFLGFLLNHRALGEAPRDFGGLLVASSCLYMAGMVFNDVFDRKIDAQERPNRPIPSGRVPLKSAVLLGSLLIAIGMAAAGVVGTQSLFIALGLTLCILAYDALLKQTPLGPIAMGACRFLNVMLGASALDRALFIWTWPVCSLALGLGVYIVGVTWFARREAVVSSRWQLAGAMGVVNLGLAALGAYVMRVIPGAVNSDGVLLALVVVALVLNRRLAAALFDPIPGKVQRAVATMLFSLVVLDATMVFFKTADAGYALATVALLAPAMLLGRWVFVT